MSATLLWTVLAGLGGLVLPAVLCRWCYRRLRNEYLADEECGSDNA